MKSETPKVETVTALRERIASDLEASTRPQQDTSEHPPIDGSSITRAIDLDAKHLSDFDEWVEEESVQELLVDFYDEAEKHIRNARGALWEVIDLGDPPQEVANLLRILFDAAVSVRLLRSNVDGLLDGVLPQTTNADTDADGMAE
jgi:hypothetical protein